MSTVTNSPTIALPTYLGAPDSTIVLPWLAGDGRYVGRATVPASPHCPTWCTVDLTLSDFLPDDTSVNHLGAPIRVPVEQHPEGAINVAPERFDPNPTAGDIGPGMVHITGTDFNMTPAEARDLARALLTAAAAAEHDGR